MSEISASRLERPSAAEAEPQQGTPQQGQSRRSQPARKQPARTEQTQSEPAEQSDEPVHQLDRLA